MKVLSPSLVIGQRQVLFARDLADHEPSIKKMVRDSRFLVIGGGGSIGQAVVKELFKRNPRALHVVDVSENNLVELVRDLRSSFGYIEGDFRTFAVECGSTEFSSLLRLEGAYDHVLHLAALKHVRSERDPYTLMRLLRVNILEVVETLEAARAAGSQSFFSVSTDKAVNPVSMMGASKRLMELALIENGQRLKTSSARFANVAFSAGSLLEGFSHRVAKRQPIAAPSDVLRYFISEEESGQLCLLAALLGESGDIFFPNPSPELPLVGFVEIAKAFLKNLGYEAYPCETEDEARRSVERLAQRGQWPCYFFETNTTGEREREEFFHSSEVLDVRRFDEVGVVKGVAGDQSDNLRRFSMEVRALLDGGGWERKRLIDLVTDVVPEFRHKETSRFLDDRM